MQRALLILSVAWLSMGMALAFTGSDSDTTSAPVTCGNGVPGGVNCVATKKDLKEARDRYSRGLKLQERKRFEEAFAQFDKAARLAPQDPQFLTAREMVKSQLVFDHIQRGNALLSASNLEQAAPHFRA